MDFGFEARYMGGTYPAAVGPENDDVAIFSLEAPPVHLGFEPHQNYWRKRLKKADLDGLALIRTHGNFRGERCFVLEQTGDEMHIAYAGHDAYQAEHLGYWMVDRGVYEAVVPSSEVTDTWVERVDIPVGPAAQARPPMPPSAVSETAASATSGTATAPPTPSPTPSPTPTPTPAPPLELPQGPAQPAAAPSVAQPVAAQAAASQATAAAGTPAAAASPGPAPAAPTTTPTQQESTPPSPTRPEVRAHGPSPVRLAAGTLVDRYGPEMGRLVFAEGTPFEQRSLPPSHRKYPYRVYRVIAPAGLEVLGGPVAPWFGQPGGGVMYELPRTVEELVDLNALERVEESS